jgi:hypothetical protein
LSQAEAACEYARLSGWTPRSYARPGDLAREKLDRSSTWMRDLVALGVANREFPALAAALSGSDGGRPLGRVAALCVGRIATPESVAKWIALARDCSVSDLRDAIRKARKHKSHLPVEPAPSPVAADSAESGEPREDPDVHPVDRPESADTQPNDGGGQVNAGGGSGDSVGLASSTLSDTWDDIVPYLQRRAAQRGIDLSSLGSLDEESAERLRVRFLAPRYIRVAFDQGFDLHRAISGREVALTSYVQAVVAEQIALCSAKNIQVYAPRRPYRGERIFIENLMANACENWAEMQQARLEACRAFGLSSANEPPLEGLASLRSRGDSAPDVNCTNNNGDGATPWPIWVAARPEEAKPDPAMEERLDQAIRLGQDALARLQEIAQVAGTGDCQAVAMQLRTLIRLENTLRVRLGELLSLMSDLGTWHRLGFASLVHYAEETLGLNRTDTEAMAWLARALRRFPLLRQHYLNGKVRFEAALIACRAMGRKPVDRETEAAWVERVRRRTIKSLRDELREIRRREALAEIERDEEEHDGCGEVSREAREREGRVNNSGETCEAEKGAGAANFDYSLLPSWEEVTAYLKGETSEIPGSAERERRRKRPRRAPKPFTDAEWYKTLDRRPGDTLRQIAQLGLLAAANPNPDIRFDWTLPNELAHDFACAIEKWRRILAERARSKPPDEPWSDPLATPALLAARACYVETGEVPPWVGLLAMLENYIATWDRSPKRALDRVYRRSGYRCEAPGCTGRVIEDHHIDYESRGGSDELYNQLNLCPFHHRQGEHGVLASCHGTAPLDVYWRLGKVGMEDWFHGETLLEPQEFI